MSSILYWHRRRGTHFGQCNQGPTESERDRQNRRRTYFINKVEARYFITYRDLGMRDNVPATQESFRLLRSAQQFAQQHLETNTPKLKLTLKGRTDQGNLMWNVIEQGARSNISSHWTVDAEEFYEGMVTR